jgi:NAD(P)-dependent dehydrogenase (short-subunit alcohol dehydrogenase family)
VAGIAANTTGIAADIANQGDLEPGRGRRPGAGLDILFADAGTAEAAGLGAITWRHYADALNTNIGGTLFAVQTLIPLLNRGASIVLNSSSVNVKGRLCRRQGHAARRRSPTRWSSSPRAPAHS